MCLYEAGHAVWGGMLKITEWRQVCTLLSPEVIALSLT